MSELEPDIKDQIKQKNKQKLLHQNSKLYTELKRLQVEIQAFQGQQEIKEQSQPHLVSSLKQQLQVQERQIKRLKEMVEAGRQANIKQNVIYIRKEEDQLLFLKKEHHELQQQKELVSSARQDKLNKLSNNEPLEKHKEGLRTIWADTKKENRQLNLKMVEMERQIRKYHSIKERAKNKNDNNVNEQGQLASIELQLQRMNLEMKNLESKWKPGIDVLDNQFFYMKSQLSAAQRKIEEGQKEEDSWKRRSAALRNQSDLASDRERLAKVVAMPKPEPPSIEEPKHRYHLNSGASGFEIQKDLIKNIKSYNSSLPRAESTPTHPSIVKRSFEPTQLNKSHRSIKKQGSTDRQTNRSQQDLIGSLQKVKREQKNNLVKGVSFKSEKRLESPPKTDKKAIQQMKNYVGVRDRHRIKSTVPPPATTLSAVQIKKKEDPVKQPKSDIKVGNKFELQGKDSKKNRERILVPSPTDLTSKQAKINSIPRIEKQEKVKQAPLSPKLKRQKSNSSIKDSLIASQKKKQEIPSKQSKPTEQLTNKQIKAMNNKLGVAGKREKQLIETIDLTPQNNRVSSPLKPNPQHKREQHQQAKDNRSVQKQIISASTSQKPQKTKIELSPASPSPKVRPEKSKTSVTKAKSSRKSVSPQLPSIAIQLEDEEDGVPKIIRRKRAPQGNLVTTGTST